MTIELDGEHVYRVDGVVKPSVSEILSLYFPASVWYTEDGREKGRARHSWFNCIVQNLEIENRPDPAIAGDVDSFRRFMSEVRPEYISGEVPYFDKVLGVCGTPDLVCKINGKLSVCDFKPWTKIKRTQVQTAAYKRLLNANGIPVVNRYELRLSPDGYRLEQHKDANDERRWPIFVAGWAAAQFYK